MRASARRRYAPTRSIALQGFVGYQTDLEFETGETFVGLGAGDIEGLSFVAQDNHLFLKPKAAKVGTNLTILTSRAHLPVRLLAQRAPSGPATPEEVTYVLRFTYPAHARRDRRPQSGSSVTLAQASPTRREHRLLVTAAARRCSRVAASDDGVHTRLRFGARRSSRRSSS